MLSTSLLLFNPSSLPVIFQSVVEYVHVLYRISLLLQCDIKLPEEFHWGHKQGRETVDRPVLQEVNSQVCFLTHLSQTKRQ